MRNHDDEQHGKFGERLLTPDDVADLLGVSVRKVLILPIKQLRLGTRTIRYTLEDVYDFLGLEHPNP